MALFKVHLRSRIIFSYMLLLLLWMVVFTIDSFDRAQNMVEEQVRLSMQSNLQQVKTRLNYHLQEMRYISNMIIMANPFRNELRYSHDTGNTADLIRELESYHDQTEFLSTLRVVYRTYTIRVYMDDRAWQAREGTDIFPLSYLENTSWFERLKTNTGVLVWSELPDSKTNSNEIQPKWTLVRKLRFNVSRNSIDAVAVALNDNELKDLLLSSFQEQGGCVYLVDPQGIAVIYGNPDYAMDTIENVTTRDGEFMLFSEEGKQYLSTTLAIGGDWKIVSIVPWYVLDASVGKMRLVSLVTLSIATIITIILIMIFSYRFSYRIRLLVLSMDKVGQDSFTGVVEVHANDEIGKIERMFNLMNTRLKQGAEKIRVIELRKREAEMRALQAQINPHFLYNTLDAINWMAASDGNMAISSMAVSLGNFFRLSLSGGCELIPIRDELKITQLYVDIQKIRMGEALDVFFDVSEDVLDYLSVKLLIQPLVENSVKHGFRGDEEKHGEIHICIALEGDQIVASVSDNGAGVDWNYLSNKTPSGYGLRNVRERLELYFGSNSEIKLSSGIDSNGACVTMRWRARKI